MIPDAPLVFACDVLVVVEARCVLDVVEPVPVLVDVSLGVGQHEFLAVVGPSGCGKSTLLNLTAGLMPPTSGAVLYGGHPVTGVNTKVGYLTQRDNLLPWRTVSGNIELPLEIRGSDPTSREQLVEEMISLVGLQGFAKHYPSELSGGMRKRVALARTLIYEPETLLMDEPFGALDAQLRQVMHGELMNLWTKSKKTVVFITHDLGEAITLADRVIVMSARPARIKAIHDVPISHPRNVYTIRFSSEFKMTYEYLWEELRNDIVRGTEQ